MSRRLQLFLFLFLLSSHLSSARQRILEGPSDVAARLNETIVLKCTVENQEGAVQWLKNGFGLGSTRDLVLYERYSMIGRPSQGEYHLQIRNATLEDEAQYECHIEETASNPSQTSEPAHVVITSPPDDPKIQTKKDTLSFQEGQNVELSCLSANGRPTAQIAWVIASSTDPFKVHSFLGNASVILKDTNLYAVVDKDKHNAIVREEVVVHDSQLKSKTSHISFPLSKIEDKKFIVCVATHPTYQQGYKTDSISLDVSYAPIVEIKMDESRSTLEEGGQAALTCNYEAKPDDNVRIFWTQNDQLIENGGSDTVVIRNLRMEDHDRKIICHAENVVGVGETAYKLNVNFGPRIITASQIKAVERGESVTFVCEANGNPEPSIHWVRKTNNEMIIAKGNRLTIDSVQPWQAGEYECIATVLGFEPAKMRHFLHLKGPPMIDFSEKAIKYENNKVVMTCQARGKPFPKQIIWSKDGHAINFEHSNGRIQVQESHKEFGIESRLTILRVTEHDYGFYNCSAVNEFGNHFVVAELHEPTFFERLFNSDSVSAVSQQLELGALPGLLILALAFIVALLIFFTLIFCIKKCCCPSEKKAAIFSDDPSDVTVRCEALDGVQYYAGDVYNAGNVDNIEILPSKDYISVPQNNPDLDYLPPPNIIYQSNHGYLHPQSHEFLPTDNSLRYESATYNSFIPHSVHNGQTVDLYGNATYLKHPAGQLETLTEVATPDTESGTPLLLSSDVHERATSQMSTHV